MSPAVLFYRERDKLNSLTGELATRPFENLGAQAAYQSTEEGFSFAIIEKCIGSGVDE